MASNRRVASINPGVVEIRSIPYPRKHRVARSGNSARAGDGYRAAPTDPLNSPQTELETLQAPNDAKSAQDVTTTTWIHPPGQDTAF